MRFVVVGGGILGLATARQLALSDPEAEVVVLERESALAQHQTSHNSGVVHAGIYYAPGSLKARLCRRGLTLLRDFCTERGLPYDACGKVVVAVDEREVEPLRRLEERATTNGVPGLRWLEQSDLSEVEPHVQGVAGLHSPETAIADFAAVARAYAADVTAAGGQIRTGVAVTRVSQNGRNPRTELADGTTIDADKVIVCAGLQADRLAMASGEPAEPRIVPFRGEYWQLRPERTHLVRGLIYPVPDPALPFLGRAPDAQDRRHGRARAQRDPVDGPSRLRAPAVRRPRRLRGDQLAGDAADAQAPLACRHRRDHPVRLQAPIRPRGRALRPSGHRPADVLPASAGVRAQAIDRDGSLVDDFRLGTSGNVIWVRNAPSPAATSSMAIAEELVAHAVRA